MSKLCFSADGEIFNATEKDEILDSLFSDDRLLVIGARYWSADLVRPKASSFFDVETILDAAQQAAYELCDEYPLEMRSAMIALSKLKKQINKAPNK